MKRLSAPKTLIASRIFKLFPSYLAYSRELFVGLCQKHTQLAECASGGKSLDVFRGSKLTLELQGFNIRFVQPLQFLRNSSSATTMGKRKRRDNYGRDNFPRAGEFYGNSYSEPAEELPKGIHHYRHVGEVPWDIQKCQRISLTLLCL